MQQPQVGVRYGQSAILNVKTRKLYVKLVNASADAKKANVNLKRFSLKKLAVKTTLAGAPDDENNYEKQPIAPKTETFKPKKQFAIDLQPYSMVMLEYQL